MGIQTDAAIIGASLNGISLAGLQAGMVNTWLMNTLGGNAVMRAGLHYAAAGGELTKGVFVWQGVNAAGTPVWKPFTFQMNPNELNQSFAPDYAAIKVPGQNDPQYAFIHGGEKTLTFTLVMFYVPASQGFITGRIQLLRELVTRPAIAKDTKGANNGPPPVFFYFGHHIQGERFIVTKMDVKCFDLFDPAYLLPMRAEVQLELKSAPLPVGITGPSNVASGGVANGTITSILKAVL